MVLITDCVPPACAKPPLRYLQAERDARQRAKEKLNVKQIINCPKGNKKKGVIGTGLLAVLFMCLFLVTDSLILAILLHFIVDFSATFILSEKNIENSKNEIQRILK